MSNKFIEPIESLMYFLSKLGTIFLVIFLFANPSNITNSLNLTIFWTASFLFFWFMQDIAAHVYVRGYLERDEKKEKKEKKK